MLNEIAVQYFDWSIIRPAAFVVGAIVSHHAGGGERTLTRVPFVGRFIFMVISAQLLWVAVAALRSPALADQYLWLAALLDFATFTISGFYLWRIASARSRDASGANGWAIRCFIPIIQLVALPYLAFKPTESA